MRHQLGQQDFQFDLAQLRQRVMGIDAQQIAVQLGGGRRVQPKRRRQHRRGQLLQKSVIFQIAAQGQKEFQPEIQQYEFAFLRLAGRFEIVQVVRPDEEQVAGLQELAFGVDPVDQRAVGHQQNFGEIMGVRRSAAMRQYVEIQIAAGPDGFRFPAVAPGDFVAGDPRFQRRVEPVRTLLEDGGDHTWAPCSGLFGQRFCSLQ